MRIRLEGPADVEFIRGVVREAFESAPHSSGTEAAIVDALRQAGALTLSLVAEGEGEVIGHIAFSPVTINGECRGWYGLGPVAVRPHRQRQGIGQALVRAGLDGLKERGAAGCVVVGDPNYYGRFGFKSDPELRYGDIPPPYLQRFSFGDERPSGLVAYHEAFEAA